MTEESHQEMLCLCSRGVVVSTLVRCGRDGRWERGESRKRCIVSFAIRMLLEWSTVRVNTKKVPKSTFVEYFGSSDFDGGVGRNVEGEGREWTNEGGNEVGVI